MSQTEGLALLKEARRAAPPLRRSRAFSRMTAREIRERAQPVAREEPDEVKERKIVPLQEVLQPVVGHRRNVWLTRGRGLRVR